MRKYLSFLQIVNGKGEIVWTDFSTFFFFTCNSDLKDTIQFLIFICTFLSLTTYIFLMFSILILWIEHFGKLIFLVLLNILI